MPVEWTLPDDVIRLGGVGAQKISTEDGTRQQETARAILTSLKEQPGVILADEVGMGKTYVALAVVASVLNSTRGSGRPVIVMVPPGLASKWPRDWKQFRSLCVSKQNALNWVEPAFARSPADFFKMIDDPRGKRPHLIWITTSCFHMGLNDP